MIDTTFVDTSALFALTVSDDAQHRRAHAWMARNETALVTHSWVLVESTALLHQRLGATAAHELVQQLPSNVEIIDVDMRLRSAGIARYAASPNSISLIDATSFEVMHAIGCTRAFAFDRHFAQAGFELVPRM